MSKLSITYVIVAGALALATIVLAILMCVPTSQITIANYTAENLSPKYAEILQKSKEQQEQINGLEFKLDENGKILVKTQNDLDIANKSIEEKNSIIAEKNALIEQKDTSITSLTNEKTQLQADVDLLTQQKAEVQEQYEQELITIEERNATISTLNATIEQKNATIQEKETIIATLTNDKETLQNEVDSLTQEKAQLEQQIETLNNQITTLETEKAQLQNEVSDLENQLQQQDMFSITDNSRFYNIIFRIDDVNSVHINNNLSYVRGDKLRTIYNSGCIPFRVSYYDNLKVLYNNITLSGKTATTEIAVNQNIEGKGITLPVTIDLTFKNADNTDFDFNSIDDTKTYYFKAQDIVFTEYTKDELLEKVGMLTGLNHVKTLSVTFVCTR